MAHGDEQTDAAKPLQSAHLFLPDRKETKRDEQTNNKERISCNTNKSQQTRKHISRTLSVGVKSSIV